MKPTILITDRATFVLQVKLEAHEENDGAVMVKARSNRHRKPKASNVRDALDYMGGDVELSDDEIQVGSHYAMTSMPIDKVPAGLRALAERALELHKERKAKAAQIVGSLNLGQPPAEA